MGRAVALVVVVVASAAGVAHAGKKKVLITSTPDKASVYVGTVDDGERCKTPCSVDIDGGETVIVDLAGHKPQIGQLVLKRGEKPPYKRSYKLSASIGTLKVDGPAGAVVLVDGVEKGKIPFEDDVPTGSHGIQIKQDGKEIYTTAIEVPEDEDVRITVPTKTVATKKPDDEDKTDEDTKPPAVVKKATPSEPRAGNLFSVSSAFSIGFRDFTYKNVQAMTTRKDLGPETEGGQVLAGVVAEIWPGTLAGVHALRGLSLAGRVQLGVNSQTVVDSGNAALATHTFWRSFEVGAHQRWTIADAVAFEVVVGYVNDEHGFSGGDSNKVPDTDYQSLLIGGRASFLLGHVEPYLGGENRIVMSGGPLETRFPAGADASGVRVAAGVAVHSGHLGGRVEGSLTRYSWTFAPGSAVDTDGATDNIKQISIALGYAY